MRVDDAEHLVPVPSPRHRHAPRAEHPKTVLVGHRDTPSAWGLNGTSAPKLALATCDREALVVEGARRPPRHRFVEKRRLAWVRERRFA